jgi:predicted Rdx family selenoprotein
VCPAVSLTPAERTARARLAAHVSWAKTTDRSARTAKARAAFEQKFRDEVDPDRELSESEREKRAASARNAYFQRLKFSRLRAATKKAAS